MYKIYFHTFLDFWKKVGMIKKSDLQTFERYRTKPVETGEIKI